MCRSHKRSEMKAERATEGFVLSPRSGKHLQLCVRTSVPGSVLKLSPQPTVRAANPRSALCLFSAPAFGLSQ